MCGSPASHSPQRARPATRPPQIHRLSPRDERAVFGSNCRQFDDNHARPSFNLQSFSRAFVDRNDLIARGLVDSVSSRWSDLGRLRRPLSPSHLAQPRTIVARGIHASRNYFDFYFAVRGTTRRFCLFLCSVVPDPPALHRTRNFARCSRAPT